MAIRSSTLPALALVSLSLFSWSACDEQIQLPVDGSGDALALLRYVNYIGTTEHVLRADARLTDREAQALIDYRDGADRAPSTHDDNRFGTVRELNLVINAEAIGRLSMHALERGWLPHDDPFLGYWDHVAFTLAEAELVLDAVNTWTYDELDDDAALNSSVVDGIFAARPFSTIEALSGVQQMGKVNLQRLKDYALAYEGSAPVHGSTL